MKLLAVCVKWIFKVLIAFGLCVHLLRAHCERHFLQYVYTVTSSDPSVYSAVGVCDDIQITHFNNKKQNLVRNTALSADNWRSCPVEPPESRDRFLNLFYTLANCINSKCTEVHTLQRRIGCEVMKSSSGKIESLTAYDEYRFDGEDFITLDITTMQWMDKSPAAKENKMQWDKNTAYMQYLRLYLSNCMTWISTYNPTKSLPKIDMFAVEAHHDRCKLNLTCMATGFYPKDIKMDVTLNGIKFKSLHTTGVRPNHDNTFQMRTTVEINREDKDGLECHVTHSSLTQPVIIKWDGNCKNCHKSSRSHAILFVVLAILALVIILCVSRRKTVNALRSNEERPDQRNSEVTQQLNGNSDQSETQIQVEEKNGVPGATFQH